MHLAQYAQSFGTGRRPVAAGIPVGMLAKAGELLVGGSQQMARNEIKKEERNLRQAATAVTEAVSRFTVPASQTRYSRLLNTRAFHLTGFTHPVGMGSAEWGDVLKNFASQTGEAVIGRFIGRAPPPMTVIQAGPKEDSGISGTTIALLGAAGLGVLYLVLRK